MEWSFGFFVNSVLLGVGLAMDAFAVSMANGLNEPRMKKTKMNLIAATFGVFQALMPIIGWVCVHTIVTLFSSLEKFVPWIALILLGYIGGKMLAEGIRGGEDESKPAVGVGALIVQGIATSIDALSVGFTISDYNWNMALVAAVIIAVVTYAICMFGLFIGIKSEAALSGKTPFLSGIISGKKNESALAGKASILGGVILIIIGLEIFIKGLLNC